MRTWFNRVKENRFLHAVIPFLLLGVLTAVFALATGGNFVSSRNLNVILGQTLVTAVVSTGASFIFATGNVNIAMGSATVMVAALAGIVYKATNSVPLMFLVAVGTGVVIMVICVLLSTKFHIFVIHVTIVMMTLLTAIASEMLGGNTLSLPYKMTKAANDAGVPYIIFIGFSVFCIVLFHFTPVGRYIRMVGSNETCAELTGLQRSRALMVAFVMAGIGSGLAALLMIFRNGSVAATMGSSINTDVMLAIVLGGMPIYGGSKSRVYAPILGALIVVALNNGLLMVGVDSSWVQGIRGVIFLAFLLLGTKRAKLLPAREG